MEGGRLAKQKQGRKKKKSRKSKGEDNIRISGVKNEKGPRNAEQRTQETEELRRARSKGKTVLQVQQRTRTLTFFREGRKEGGLRKGVDTAYRSLGREKKPVREGKRPESRVQMYRPSTVTRPEKNPK